MNPRYDFSTLLKVRGSVVEGNLQNAKPSQMQVVSWSVVGLNTRPCVPIPSWTSVETTMAAVIQMLFSLTGGGQDTVDMTIGRDLHLQTRIAKHLETPSDTCTLEVGIS